MKEKVYRRILIVMIAVSIGFCIFLGLSLALPQEWQDYENEAADGSVTQDTRIEETTSPPQDTRIEETTSPPFDYSSLIYEGMIWTDFNDAYDVIKADNKVILSDWRIHYLKVSDDSFLMVQLNYVMPMKVSSISEHSYQTPEKTDLEMLEEGMSIVEISEVWGCPTDHALQSDFTETWLIYDLTDGRRVIMYYSQDEQDGMYYLDRYKFYN